ncbi:hypothetical protein XP420_15565 [Xanthomonas perforans]|uniref:hypothetical protein n=1 Tax=Xanthomonas perforans TaxID=442694 RepID=UPI00062D34B9|nr:hypothetical protein [Xanthomonas perforans]KLC04028.1 hypothetical protein XP420_15565 [Xanthomonas perforans]
MAYAFIILLVAGIFLYVAFRKPAPVQEDPIADDDMSRFNPVRATYDDVYAKAWGVKNGLDD